jgi:pyruvate formate-lyase activating enzyme-like uncharacterized protein
MEFTQDQGTVLKEIEAWQARLPGLCYHKPHQSVSTGPLLPGCAICVRKGYLSFQLGFACNARCPFCFLETHPPSEPDEDEEYHRRAQLKRFERQVEQVEGVALTGGEPLLYLEELEPAVAQMRAAKDDLYFWIYSNGLIADRQHLRVVRDLGIQEIRFNLAATDYRPEMLEAVSLAREMIERVAVEVASYPPQKEALIAILPELERVGIDQLNLQELWVTPANVDRLSGEGYQAGVLFAKKHFLWGSRQMTYEVMARCIEEGYFFTVNDCTASEFGRSR